MVHARSLALACLGVLALTAPAAADVGDARTIVVDGDLDLDLISHSPSGEGASSWFTASIALGGHYFVADRFSLGGAFRYEHGSSDYSSSSSRGLTAEAGYFAKVGDKLHWWPRVGLGVASSEYSDELNGFSSSNRQVTFQLYAPLMYQLDRVLVGIGPVLRTDLANDVETEFGESSGSTSYGLQASFGVWFGD